MTGLRPHQVAPYEHLLRLIKQGRTGLVDWSDTGTGKTYVTAALLATLKLPTLVVGPKISKTAWENASAHFGDSVSFLGYEMLRTGRTPFGWWEKTPPADYSAERRLVCTNCLQEFDVLKPHPCYCHPQGIHCVETKKSSWNYGKFQFAPEVKAVVFDEGHRCNGVDSLNSEMLIGAKRDGKLVVCLSATPACSPLDMKALGYTLGLHTLRKSPRGLGLSFTNWVGRYGCRHVPSRGLQWLVGKDRQLEVMSQLRDEVIPNYGVRVTTGSIPGFPARTIMSELYDLDEDVDKVYAEMESPLTELEERASHDRDPNNPMTRILRGRQKVELMKVPVAIELAQDYLAKGLSVALFVNFKQTLDELCARLNCDCFIDGSPDGVKNRAENIARFQSNQSRIIVVNNQAGGISVSLHDLDGRFPRMGIVFPCFSATVMRQVFGRLPRDGGKSPCFYRVIFAAKSVEVPLHRGLSQKLNNLDALVDADLTPENLQFAA